MYISKIVSEIFRGLCRNSIYPQILFPFFQNAVFYEIDLENLFVHISVTLGDNVTYYVRMEHVESVERYWLTLI